VIEWTHEVERKEMELNERKSKVMKVSKGGEGNNNIQCKGEMLEPVDSYIYLSISQYGRRGQEVANRVQKANNAYFQMNDIIFGKRKLEMKTKTRIYQSVIATILLHVSRITATEMRCYRKIVGKTKRD
jgi:hypothetical protein